MQVSLGPATLLDGDPAPPPPKAHSPQFSAHICCGQMAGWFKMPRGREVDLGPGDLSMWQQSSPSQKKGRTAPNFWLMTSVAKRLYQDTTWYGGRPQPNDIVRWGPSSTSPKGAQSPLQFSANVHCGQTAGWTKMQLNGMEVGLSPGDCLTGTQLPQEKKAQPHHPIFGRCLLWPKRLDGSRCHLVWG